MKLKIIPAVICLFILVSPLFAAKTGKTEELAAGAEKSSSIDLSADFGIPTRTFSVRVPKSAYGIRLSLDGAQADLDLFLNRSSKSENLTASDFVSEDDEYNETLFITRQSDTALETGLYYVSVVYQYDYLPMIDGKRVDEIDFTIKYEIITSDPETALTPGIPETIMLKPENGMFAVVSVDIPRTADNFRIDVFNTDADIDIFAATKTPAKSRDEAMYVSESMLGTESLIIGGYPQHKFITGRYYITLLDQLAKELPRELSVLVTLDTEAPELITDVPILPEPIDSFEAAMLSTVEIIAENGKGSGCILSRDGYTVTNWHVVEGSDGKPSEEIFAAVSLSTFKPPVELFQAELIDYDEELDLALLRINAGRYGQELSYNYEFPYFHLGDPDSLRISQPLGILGYPEVGGTGSRTSITFTSGIVSGFEAAPGCSLIKTDALIGSGNSGGAVINAYYELLGIPGYIMDINSDKMGYIYPVSCFPDDWIDMIEEANNR
ncbi:MAG: trypsin-like peptidase domain-containing protein [Spirochaetales bacterium]|uniref:Trypsin-like peptidase domain-containing protein n=1 Tax=Candidatus Thalassospirochaeta sargassi TaxID=3119039 RepID=A0AAJ1I9W5_9SPIO|nr:trypsin-like peptidase domain-containing protein [Spirochaetales bacterium]